MNGLTSKSILLLKCNNSSNSFVSLVPLRLGPWNWQAVEQPREILIDGSTMATKSNSINVSLWTCFCRGTLGQNWVWPYRDIEQNPNRPLPTPETYDDEIANLKRWTLGRLEWYFNSFIFYSSALLKMVFLCRLDEAMKGPFMHSYTNVGTACDVYVYLLSNIFRWNFDASYFVWYRRGTYIREFFGPDCAPGCNKDQVDAVQYPTCLRKVVKKLLEQFIYFSVNIFNCTVGPVCPGVCCWWWRPVRILQGGRRCEWLVLWISKLCSPQ